ncbi:unnamed protein product [Durusdinium trenchii]|uniref:Uncharacterized protein n=1 Tax=Durusdinium trenchii TaxID=1381693 RepID=A0ABP0MJI0_9DINO
MARWSETAVLQRLKKVGAPKVLAFACLLLLWNTSISFEPPYLFVETFSGEAAATRAVRHCFPARATAASDIKYTVSMDINTSGGMGACLTAILRGDASGGFVHWLGVLCSSFVTTSRGSSGRSLLNPEGLESYPSVLASNHMAARVALLCIATYAFFGTWIIEQPNSSILFQTKRMQHVCGLMQVFKSGFWMWHYKARTQKRTMLWSPSKLIGKFWRGKLNRAEYLRDRDSRNPDHKPPPCRQYRDKSGRKRFQGTSSLRDTGTYTYQFGLKIASLIRDLLPSQDPAPHDETVDPIAVWESWSWGDMWDDASMRDLVAYLYGSASLSIPPEWRRVLPREL